MKRSSLSWIRTEIVNTREVTSKISLPVKTDISLNILNNSDIEIIRSFQNGLWYVWTKNNLSSTDKELKILTNGNGYWIKATNNTSIVLIGETVSNKVSIEADGDWHMSGSVTIEDVSVFLA